MSVVSYLDTMGVTVTDKRLVTPGGDTYAMNQISSVKMRVTEPNRKGPAIVAGIGILGLFFGGELLWGSLAWLAGGIVWFVIQKSVYHVMLSFAGNETEALSCKDRGLIESVVEAVNRVVVER
jgi:hypothetical protein